MRWLACGERISKNIYLPRSVDVIWREMLVVLCAYMVFYKAGGWSIFHLRNIVEAWLLRLLMVSAVIFAGRNMQAYTTFLRSRTLFSRYATLVTTINSILHRFYPRNSCRCWVKIIKNITTRSWVCNKSCECWRYWWVAGLIDKGRRRYGPACKNSFQVCMDLYSFY